MKTIRVRWNNKIQEWETFSLVLQGWTVANNLRRYFSQEDVKAYYAQFGKLVQFSA